MHCLGDLIQNKEKLAPCLLPLPNVWLSSLRGLFPARVQVEGLNPGHTRMPSLTSRLQRKAEPPSRPHILCL